MTPAPTNRLTTLLGSWMLLEGIWGMFNPIVLGFITTNRVRAAVHIVLGLVGLATAFAGGARRFLWALGLIALAVGFSYFIPAGEAVVELLAVNRAAAVINCLIGLVALLCAAMCSDEFRPLRR